MALIERRESREDGVIVVGHRLRPLRLVLPRRCSMGTWSHEQELHGVAGSYVSLLRVCVGRWNLVVVVLARADDIR